MTTFNVISADIITKSGIEPFVGLTVIVNGTQKQVARTCKQALLDLHKSARASNVPSSLFDNGVASAHPMLYNLFREAIIGLIGKVGMGEVEFYEAGSEYEVTDVSSAYKAGTAQLGDILKTEKAGARIEGFLAYPLSDLENAQRAFMASADPMLIMQGLFGITPPSVAVTQAPVAKIGGANTFDPIEEKLNTEVFGASPEIEEEETPEVAPATAKGKATAK